jgi:hypothetical protein
LHNAHNEAAGSEQWKHSDRLGAESRNVVVIVDKAGVRTLRRAANRQKRVGFNKPQVEIAGAHTPLQHNVLVLLNNDRGDEGAGQSSSWDVDDARGDCSAGS